MKAQLQLALVFMLLGLSATRGQTTWTGTASSEFTDAGNWSSGVPDGSKTATFDAAAQTAVNLSATTPVQGIVFANTYPSYGFDSSTASAFTLGSGGLNVGPNGVSVTFGGQVGFMLAGSQTWTVDRPLTVSGQIGGSASYGLTIQGSSTLTLAGTNIYAGGTTFAGGTVLVSSDSNLGDTSGALTFNGGTLKVSSGVTSGRTILLPGAGTIDTNSFEVNLSGNISGTGGLTRTGTGILRLGGTSTYTGGTTINSGGVVEIMSDNNLGATSSVVTLNGGYLRTSGSIAAVTHDLVLGPGGGNLNSNGYNSTFTGKITGSGSLAVRDGNGDGDNTGWGAGTGIVTLTNTANDYTGGTYIQGDSENDGGILAVSDDRQLGIASGPVFIDGGTLKLTADINSLRPISVGSHGGTLAVSGGQTMYFSGTLSGNPAGPVVKMGTGTLKFMGATPSSPGLLVINAGTIDLRADGVLSPATDLTVGPTTSEIGAKLAVNAAQEIRGLAGYGGVEIASGKTLTINLPGPPGPPAFDTTFHGTLMGAGSLVRTGSSGSTLTLAGPSATYTGTITVASGVLAVTDPAALGSSTGGTVVNSPGSLRLDNVALGAEPLTLTGGGSGYAPGALLGTGTASASGPITIAGYAAIHTPAAGDTLTLSGGVTESTYSTLTKSGPGTLVINGPLSLSGAIRIPAGKLKLAGSTSLGGAVHVGSSEYRGILEDGAAGSFAPSSGVFLYNGDLIVNFSETIRGLGDLYVNGIANPGVATLGAGATLTISGAGSTFSGRITGSGALRVQNNAVETLAGSTNDYTGGTTVANGGTLYVSASDAVGTGTLTVMSGGQLAAQGSPNPEIPVIEIGASVALESGATLGRYGDSSSANALELFGTVTTSGASPTLSLAEGSRTYFSGTLTSDTDGGQVAFAGQGFAILSGTIGSKLTTIASDRAPVVFASTTALPASITARNGGYIGMAAPLSGAGVATLVSRITDPTEFGGTLGFDSNPGQSETTEFSGTANLQSFGAGFYGLGSATSARLGSGFTIAVGTGDYRFGGGGGRLVVQSSLTGTSNGLVVRSPSIAPLTLVLQGSNTFDGPVSVIHSYLVLDSAAAYQPATSKITLGESGYVSVTENSGRTFGDLAGWINAAAVDILGVIGFDSAQPATLTRTVSETIDFSALAGASNLPYLGTTTRELSLTGSIVVPEGKALRLAGMGEGALHVVAPLTAANGVSSVVIGHPDAAMGAKGTVILSGNNTYTGNTTLLSGQLIVNHDAALGLGGGVVVNGGLLTTSSGVTLDLTTASHPFTFTSGTLGGTGLMKFDTSLHIGGDATTLRALVPGFDAPGVLSLNFSAGSELCLDSKGVYEWRLADATNAAGGWSAIQVQGNVNITATSADPFRFTVRTIDAAGQPAPALNFDQDANYSWTLLTATSITGFDSTKFQLDAWQMMNAKWPNAFSLSATPTSILLNYTPTAIPEPSTWGLLLGGLAATALALRRRRS